MYNSLIYCFTRNCAFFLLFVFVKHKIDHDSFHDFKNKIFSLYLILNTKDSYILYFLLILLNTGNCNPSLIIINKYN